MILATYCIPDHAWTELITQTLPGDDSIDGELSDVFSIGIDAGESSFRFFDGFDLLEVGLFGIAISSFSCFNVWVLVVIVFVLDSVWNRVRNHDKYFIVRSKSCTIFITISNPGLNFNLDALSFLRLTRFRILSYTICLSRCIQYQRWQNWLSFHTFWFQYSSLQVPGFFLKWDIKWL